MGDCNVDGCDGEHIARRECHFGDGAHRAKGFCSRHYFRQLRGIPLELERRKGFAKLTVDDVRLMRHMRNDDGEPLRVIAARFGVSMCAVSKACRGDSWADVD